MPENKPLRGLRILVAEDTAIQAFDLKAMLERARAEIIGPTRTIAEVQALTKVGPLHCAILDILLRGDPVYIAAGVLKERGYPLIFYAGTADLNRLRQDRPDAQVLGKPAPAELWLQASVESYPPPLTHTLERQFPFDLYQLLRGCGRIDSRPIIK
jgi:hypothetical protein